MEGRLRTADGHKQFIIRGTGTIGRSSDNSCQIPGQSVSKRQARIDIDEHGNAMIYDLQSRNGTSVGDRKLQNASSVLKHGDTIKFGNDNDIYVFELMAPPNSTQLPVQSSPQPPLHPGEPMMHHVGMPPTNEVIDAGIRPKRSVSSLPPVPESDYVVVDAASELDDRVHEQQQGFRPASAEHRAATTAEARPRSSRGLSQSLSQRNVQSRVQSSMNRSTPTFGATDPSGSGRIYFRGQNDTNRQVYRYDENLEFSSSNVPQPSQILGGTSLGDILEEPEFADDDMNSGHDIESYFEQPDLPALLPAVDGGLRMQLQATHLTDAQRAEVQRVREELSDAIRAANQVLAGVAPYEEWRRERIRKRNEELRDFRVATANAHTQTERDKSQSIGINTNMRTRPNETPANAAQALDRTLRQMIYTRLERRFHRWSYATSKAFKMESEQTRKTCAYKLFHDILFRSIRRRLTKAMARWVAHTHKANIHEYASKLALSRARADRLARELLVLGSQTDTNANYVAERALNKKLLQRIHELETKLQTDAAAMLKLIDVAGEGKVVQQLLAAKEQEAERWRFRAVEHEELYKKMIDQFHQEEKPRTDTSTKLPHTGSSMTHLNGKMTNELAIRILVDEFRTCRTQLSALQSNHAALVRQAHVAQEQTNRVAELELTLRKSVDELAWATQQIATLERALNPSSKADAKASEIHAQLSRSISNPK